MNFLLLSGQATTDAAPAVGGTEMLMTFMWIPLMIGVFYFLLIRPQKKRQRQDKAMRDNLQVADEVVTVGGIIGRVLSVKDDTVLIETGGDRTRIRVLRSSIAENRTIHDN
jgi:preprotein translocase subunit YajC